MAPSPVVEVEQTAAPAEPAPAARRPSASVIDELAAAGRAAAERLAVEGGRARRAGHRAWARLSGTAEPWWRPVRPPLASRLVAATRGALSSQAGTAPRTTTVPWRRGLLLGVGAFAVWALLDAPTLLHSAEGSPLGARRTVAVAVLRPLAAVSRDLGLSHVVGAADALLGRHGPGVVQVVGPRPPHRPTSAPPTGVSEVRIPLRSATDALSPFAAPTAADPLRVLVVGDSLGVDLGGQLADDLSATGVVSAAVDAQVDTGLARPDYYDWPAELGADLARYHPEAVVVFLGANDPQNLVAAGGAVAYGTSAWDQAYAQRVGEFMSEATASGARVLWVGMPPMADGGRDSAMARLDTIFEQQAGSHPGVTFLSSWNVLGDGQGNFAEYLPDASGAPIQVREPDGTHVSPAGAERLSQSVIAAMDRAWGLTLSP